MISAIKTKLERIKVEKVLKQQFKTYDAVANEINTNKSKIPEVEKLRVEGLQLQLNQLRLANYLVRKAGNHEDWLSDYKLPGAKGVALLRTVSDNAFVPRFPDSIDTPYDTTLTAPLAPFVLNAANLKRQEYINRRLAGLSSIVDYPITSIKALHMFTKLIEDVPYCTPHNITIEEVDALAAYLKTDITIVEEK